jgi:hypothetical protein
MCLTNVNSVNSLVVRALFMHLKWEVRNLNLFLKNKPKIIQMLGERNVICAILYTHYNANCKYKSVLKFIIMGVMKVQLLRQRNIQL